MNNCIIIWNKYTFDNIDILFVHKDYQGKGIATAICDRLEKAVQNKVITNASITARAFFEKRGYKVIKEQ